MLRNVIYSVGHFSLIQRLIIEKAFLAYLPLPILSQKIANIGLVSSFWVLKRKRLCEPQGLNPGHWILWLAEGLPEQQGTYSCSLG